MKKARILSGTGFLFIPVIYLFIELAIMVLCFFAQEILVLLAFFSLLFVLVFILTNRMVTIVIYDAENKTVTRKGLFGGFRREVRVADIVRTELRFYYREGEYILLIDKSENQNLYESLSRNMPIRVPNTAKGREFVALFYEHEQ